MTWPRYRERKEAILDRWADGLTMPEIATDLGLSKGVVKHVVATARRDGDQRAARRGDGDAMSSPVRDERMIRMSVDGASLQRIAETVGLSTWTVRRQLRAAAECSGDAAVESALVADDIPMASDNDAILAALAAEPRPRGTPRRYLDVPAGRIITPSEPPPVRRDVTARFFGDPPPGRSALCQRQPANA